MVTLRHLVGLVISIGLIKLCVSKDIDCDTRFSSLAEDLSHVVCPKNCLKAKGQNVCGTGTYSSDSHVCHAAMHAGKLIDSIGGALGITRKASHNFAESRQHGINSVHCPSTHPSFSFAGHATAVSYYIAPSFANGSTPECSAADNLPAVPTCPTPSSHCKNGGTCIAGHRHFQCSCPSGFTGGDCGHAVNTCHGITCEHSGTCIPLHTTFHCACTTQWGGQYCNQPIASCYVGVSDRNIIPRTQMSASSTKNPDLQPRYGRLYYVGQRGGQQGCWAPAKKQAGQYLQVDLGRVETIRSVLTQGRPINNLWYTTKYKISYTTQLPDFTFVMEAGKDKIFDGNHDRNTVQRNDFFPHLKARYLRVVVEEWHIWPALRIEFTTC